MKQLFSLLFLAIACTKPTPPPPPKPAPSWPETLSPAPLLYKLSEAQKKEYEALTNELLCPCGEQTEVFAACIEKKQCPEALQAARMSVRLLTLNYPRSDVEVLIAESFGKAAFQIPIEGSPIKGAQDAVVTIVEFADFQCPYCAALAPILQKVVSSRNDVRLVFKNLPIPMHPFGFLAAEAGVYAHSKGKFWELQELMFSQQGTMSREEIKRWAGEVGLDPELLEASWVEGVLAPAVKKDEAEADRLRVQGTPTLFINGRLYNEDFSVETLNAVLDDAAAATK